MATRLTTAAALLLSMMAFGAHADGYVGLDGSSMAIDNQLDDNLSPHGVRLRLGMRISDVFDIEAHIGGGSDTRTDAFDRFSTTYAGVYLKGYLPVGERSAVFALMGVAGVRHTQTLDRRDFSDSQSSFSYGFGLETQLTDRLDLSADYVRYTGDDGPFSEISAVSLGIKWYF